MIAAAQAAHPAVFARDLLTLTKPGIVVMTALTAAGGLGLAPGQPGLLRSFATLAGTALCVASANAFNMLLERDTDLLMERTRMRPLAQRRIQPATAFVLASALGIAALAVLTLVQPLAALLGAVGLAVYVLAYTPMKRFSPHALLVGCVAGSMPPLIGWAAAAGTLNKQAWVLAALLFAWQIPHFLAIAIYRKHEYAAAGIVAGPVVWSDARVRRWMIASSAVLLAVSLLPIPTALAGVPYAAAAVLAGTWMLVRALPAAIASEAALARNAFRVSLAYLPLLAMGMMIDVLVR
jgi:protoheme IX farnesyltransferase